MSIAGLAHVLSLASLLAYALASWGYARAFAGRVSTRPDAHRRMLGLGLIAHTAFLLIVNFTVDDSAAVGRFPFAMSLMSLGLVALYLVLDFRHQIALLGVFVAPAALLFMLLSAVTFHLHVSPAELFPENALLLFHLFVSACAYVLLLSAGGVGAVLLISERALKGKKPLSIEKPYPSLIALDRLQRALLSIGFFLLCLGISGALLFAWTSGRSFLDSIERLIWVVPVISFTTASLLASLIMRARQRNLAWLLVWNSAAVLVSFFGSGVWSGSFHP